MCGIAGSLSLTGDATLVGRYADVVITAALAHSLRGQLDK